MKMKKKNILWIGIGVALAAAAAIFFINKKKNDQSEKPPKKAPQLDLENPGDQSEFITSPSDSEIG
jgi:LPXTG-motif cell wall-anchored protein